MRIAVIGAPGSGKTTFSARLYAELLERGLNSTRLVTEYAQEWLGQDKEIDFVGQKNITKYQNEREEYTESCGFSPIVCDSAIWLGAVYREYWLENNSNSRRYSDNDMEYMITTMKHINKYDMTFYVPMWTKCSELVELSEFRIHDNSESSVIDKKILRCLQKHKINYHKVPQELSDREQFIKMFVELFLQKKGELFVYTGR